MNVSCINTEQFNKEAAALDVEMKIELSKSSLLLQQYLNYC
jgi:hypothetical protein